MKNQSVFSGMRVNWLAIAAGVFFLSLAGGVSAEEKDRPCMADVEKLCKDVEKGEGRIKECLKKHESEVSAACKENMAKMTPKTGDMKDPCMADKEKLCKDVKPGEGAIMKCLKQHEGELSQGCKDTMGHRKGMMK